MSRSTEIRDFVGPIWVYLLTLALFFLRFGYGFAIGDHDEILPFLYHLLDPTLFENDWFVQTQATGISVRTYFVYLLVPFGRFMAVETAVLLVYLALWVAIASGSYRLILAFGLQRVAAAGAVIAGLGVLHKWTLGSNDLVYSMLVPEMAAWALAIPAIRLKLSGRRVLAAVLLGVAAWFQILVGILVFGLLALEQIWSMLSTHGGRSGWRPTIRDTGVFAICGLPVLIPILLQQLQPPADGGGASIFYILAPFRNPVHHMFFSFPGKSILRFVLFAAGGGLALRWLGRRGLIQNADFLLRTGVLVLSGCLLTVLFTEWIPVLFIAKLQAFKLTVLFKLMALALVVGVLVEFSPSSVHRFLDQVLIPGRRRVFTALGIVALGSLVFIFAPSIVHSRLHGRVHSNSDLGQLERWIAGNSDPTAVFAIPPSNSSFRSNARRAIVVDYMAFPYHDADMLEWYSRIQDFAPIGPVETGLNIRPKLDAAFEDLEPAELRTLAGRYDFEYILRRSNLEGFRPVKGFGDWTLFRVE